MHDDVRQNLDPVSVFVRVRDLRNAWMARVARRLLRNVAGVANRRAAATRQPPAAPAKAQRGWPRS